MRAARRLMGCAGGVAALAAGVFWACGDKGKPADRQNPVTNQPEPTAVRQYCVPGARGPIDISEDSVGPLDLSMTLASLKALCPAAYYSVSYGEETTNPALVFPFEKLTVVAVQHQDSLLPGRSADGWGVSGTKGLLFTRVPLAAPWAEFRAAFGPGISDGSHGLTVMFCAHPRMLFRLDASPDSVSSERPADLSRIPGSARIKELEILPRVNPTWQC